MADPGFPVGGGGGHAPVKRGVDLQCGNFLVKMYAKMTELGSIEGACAQHAPPPRSANVYCILIKSLMKTLSRKNAESRQK